MSSVRSHSSESFPSPTLFECYGLGYAHSSPENLYPLTRCIGFRRQPEINYSKYFSKVAVIGDKTVRENFVRNSASGQQASRKSRAHLVNDRHSGEFPSIESFQPIEISPKSVVQSFGPALNPSLSPNEAPQSSDQPPRRPEFPHPIRLSKRKEDLCIGESLCFS